MRIVMLALAVLVVSSAPARSQAMPIKEVTVFKDGHAFGP